MKKVLNETMIDLFGKKQEYSNLEMTVFYTTIILISVLTFVLT